MTARFSWSATTRPSWKRSASRARSACAGEAHHPVLFPGPAAVGREGLAPLGAIAAFMGPQEAYLDRHAVQDIVGQEQAVPVLEAAHHRRVEMVRGAPIYPPDAPDPGLAVVSPDRHRTIGVARLIQHIVVYIAEAAENWLADGGPLELPPVGRTDQPRLQLAVRNPPSAVQEVEVARRAGSTCLHRLDRGGCGGGQSAQGGRHQGQVHQVAAVGMVGLGCSLVGGLIQGQTCRPASGFTGSFAAWPTNYPASQARDSSARLVGEAEALRRALGIPAR